MEPRLLKGALMPEYDGEEAQLAEYVWRLLERESDDTERVTRSTPNESRRETAPTLPSLRALGETCPEELPPVRSSHPSIPPDIGRYSMVNPRRGDD